MIDLLQIFEEHNPKLMPNGQIRMECPFRENHYGSAAFASGDGSKSFFASPEINSYHCFSCGAKGSLVRLLTTKFDVSYFSAVEAVRINFDLDDKPAKKKLDEDITWRLKIHPYLISRGYDEAVLKKHRVGIAPHTAKNGNKFSVIVIPLYNHYGRLQGIKYRVPNAHEFWYTEGFERRNYIYNYRTDYKEVLLVEGETDNWRVEGWGYDVLSTLKSEVTDEQADLLKVIPFIKIAYDNDIAGIRGAQKAYEKLHKYTEVAFINYPAKDPDVCDERAFRKAVSNPHNYAEFLYMTGLDPIKKKSK